jgi:hypothetical protein
MKYFKKYFFCGKNKTKKPEQKAQVFFWILKYRFKFYSISYFVFPH